MIRRMLGRTRKSEAMRRMLETKSHSWLEAGLALHVDSKAARRARRQAALLLPLLAGILVAYRYRDQLFGVDMPVRVITVIALVVLGWTIARDVGRAAGPALFRRMDPGTAGTVGFLIRLVTIGITLLVALNIAGLPPRTIAVGGAFTAVIFGLAAQQTLGNLIAGTVLLSARPFRVGDRVRMQSGGVAGTVEGVVSSLGLLYTTLASGEDSIMVPNSVVLNSAVIPLREPDAVDLRARLRADVRPSALQDLLDATVTVDVRSPPRIALEEFDGDEVVVRVTATPARAHEGPKLADEVLAAVGMASRERAQRDADGAGADAGAAHAPARSGPA